MTLYRLPASAPTFGKGPSLAARRTLAKFGLGIDRRPTHNSPMNKLYYERAGKRHIDCFLDLRCKNRLQHIWRKSSRVANIAARSKSDPRWLRTIALDRDRKRWPCGIGSASCRRRTARLVLRCACVARPVGAVGIDVERPRGTLDDLFRDYDLLDAFEARQVEHGVEQNAFHDRAQAARAGLAVDGLAGNGAQRLLRQREIDRLHLEQPLVLLHQCVLGLGKNELERGLVEVLERGHDGQPADEFRDQAIFQEVLRRDLTENFTGATIFRRNYLGAEADRGRPPARRDDLLEPIEGAAAYEQDVSGVDLQEFLLRMLASTLRRHRRG